MKNAFFYSGLVGILFSGSVAAQQAEPKFYAGAGFGTMTIDDKDDIKFSDADNGSIQFGYKINNNFAIEAQYSKSTNNPTAKNVVVGDVDISEVWWKKALIANPTFTNDQIHYFFPYATATLSMDFDASIETSAIYGVYRSSGDLYFKIKAGYLSEKTKLTGEVNSADVYGPFTGQPALAFTTVKGDAVFNDLIGNQKETVSERDSSFSAGLGAGYNFNNHLFAELEYTKIDEDLNSYSLSINYTF